MRSLRAGRRSAGPGPDRAAERGRRHGRSRIRSRGRGCRRGCPCSYAGRSSRRGSSRSSTRKSNFRLSRLIVSLSHLASSRAMRSTRSRSCPRGSRWLRTSIPSPTRSTRCGRIRGDPRHADDASDPWQPPLSTRGDVRRSGRGARSPCQFECAGHRPLATPGFAPNTVIRPRA